MRELREGIEEQEVVDLPAYQRKILAGSGMRISIKRFLDDFGEVDEISSGIDLQWQRQYRKRIKELRKAMEEWSNS